jgi:hypothetical protein
MTAEVPRRARSAPPALNVVLILWLAAMWPEGARCTAAISGSHAIMYPRAPAVEPAGIIAYAAPGWWFESFMFVCACARARALASVRLCAFAS